MTDVQRLSLEVMTLNPMCESVETAQGVPLTVTGVAQCKIMKVCRPCAVDRMSFLRVWICVDYTVCLLFIPHDREILNPLRAIHSVYILYFNLFTKLEKRLISGALILQ